MTTFIPTETKILKRSEIKHSEAFIVDQCNVCQVFIMQMLMNNAKQSSAKERMKIMNVEKIIDEL